MTTSYTAKLDGSYDSNTMGGSVIPEVSNVDSYWPAAFDWGLFLLRVGAFLSLFVKHGFGRLTNHAQMPWSSQNPVHAIYAAFADGICSIMVILGLGTRWAAAAIFINMFISFSFINHFNFVKHTVAFLNNQGEVMGQYMAFCLVMMIVGAGRFSLDWKLGLSPSWPAGKKKANA
jgi:putative oxidoreductase